MNRPDQAEDTKLSILIVTCTQDRLADIQSGLPSTSTHKAVQTFLLADISTEIMRSSPNLLIFSSPSLDLEQISIAERLAAAKQIPIIWFVDHDSNNFAPQAIRAGVTSLVVDGLTPSRIEPLIAVAVERHKLVSALQGELQKSKDSLAARKIIERAKGLLMQMRGMTEQEAYQTLRSMAMRQGKPLK